MIQLQHVSKQFKRSRADRKKYGTAFDDAVQDVSFHCPKGATLGLIGPNGAGKTTLLRMIAAMMQPTTGTISVAGKSCATHSASIRQQMGFMTTNTQLYEFLTADETVNFYGRINQVDESTLAQRKDELFSLLDIHAFADKRLATLSTGMKQKVNIARTLIHDPKILLLDEPTTGLDVIASRHITDLIQHSKANQRTVIFSTHRFNEVKLLCDDIVVMNHGRLSYHGRFNDFERNTVGATLEEKFIHQLEVQG
ncbi:MAG: ATP-binding cassette domain-containing protein [Mariprofundaceae bacterium]|nr:ATP-binding cassette domain-containing protein [Mariprofundaceae bacterium]